MTALTTTESEVWDLQDIIRSEPIERASAESLLAVQATLRDHLIEQHSRPSEHPGEDHGQRFMGAGPKSLQVRDEFWRREVFGEGESGGIYAAGGANRSGKTVANWGMTGLRWIRDYARGGDLFWMIAPSFDKLKQGPHKWVWEYLPRAMFGGRTWNEKLGFGTNQTLMLTLPDDRGVATIQFKTEDQELTKYESDSVRGILWTEAVREALFDSVIARLIDTNGWLLIDYLPTQAWHTDRLELNPSVYHVHFCMQDNAHNLPAGAIPKARREMTKDEAAVRIDGKNRGAEGVVIKEFIREPFAEGKADCGHLVNDQKLAPGEPCWVYMDVGKYTAATLWTVDQRGRKVAVDEVYTIGFNVADNAAELKLMLERHDRTVADVQGWYFDPAADAFTAANQATVGQQFRAAGYPFQGWTRTQAVGETAMLEVMRVGLTKFEWLVMRRCKNLIRELATWRHKTDRDGKVDPKDRFVGDNHAIDGAKAFIYKNHSRVSTVATVMVDPSVEDEW